MATFTTTLRIQEQMQTDEVEQQKTKLQQKKNRLAMEEIRLKLKERKMRTRHLIEVGGLVTKAGLDYLNTNTLYGALISLSEQLDNDPAIIDQWTEIGRNKFEQEQQKYTPVIIKFDAQPEQELRSQLRQYGLRFNRFRQEWYGNVENFDQLQQQLGGIEHDLQIIDNI
jgi:hypothetical protein